MSKRNTVSIFFSLKSSRNIMRVIERMNALASQFNVNHILTLEGLNLDTEDVTLTYCLLLENIGNKKNRSTITVENAINFMDTLFLQMFDYHPCYTSEPTEGERDQAQEFISAIPANNPVEGEETVHAHNIKSYA